MPKLVRAIATLREGGAPMPEYKTILLVGIDANDVIVPGQWMGYIKNDKVIYPFVLDTESRSLLYGGEDHATEKTTLPARPIIQGALFTITTEAEAEQEEAIYEITAIHRYDVSPDHDN